MKFTLLTSESGSSNFDLETTTEMIIYRDSYGVQADKATKEEVRKEYKDYMRQVPIISKLVRK